MGSRTRYMSYDRNADISGKRSRSTLQKAKQLTTELSRTSIEKSVSSSKKNVLVLSDQEIMKKQERKKALEQKK